MDRLRLSIFNIKESSSAGICKALKNPPLICYAYWHGRNTSCNAQVATVNLNTLAGVLIIQELQSNLRLNSKLVSSSLQLQRGRIDAWVEYELLVKSHITHPQ